MSMLGSMGGEFIDPDMQDMLAGLGSMMEGLGETTGSMPEDAMEALG